MKKTTFYKIMTFAYIILISGCVYQMFATGILFIIPVFIGLYLMYGTMIKAKLL
jgi:hypothetical protein